MFGWFKRKKKEPEREQIQVTYPYRIETPDGTTRYRVISFADGNFWDICFKTLERPGVSNEVLLVIIKDRLEQFQKGELPCPENEQAIEYIKFALACLDRRTADRMQRSVEGTYEP
jgi:hypothetical protein